MLRLAATLLTRRRAYAATLMLAVVAAPVVVLGAPGVRAPHLEQHRQIQPVAVFGKDDRVPLPPKLQPLREKIGLLFNIRQRTVCSAFCVAPDMIGTASHCLFKTLGERRPRLADFWFARNYDAVRDYARIAGFDRRAAGQNVLAGGFGPSTTPPIGAALDWAFVKLARPVCSKGVLDVEAVGPAEIAAASRAGRLFQVAYHKDYKQWQPAYSKPCQFEHMPHGVTPQSLVADFVSPQDLLLHTCDTGGASSGSPLLMETPTGPKVIGINVGTYVQSHTITHAGGRTDVSDAEAVANTGVAATAFAGPLAAFRTAHVIGTATRLQEMQTRLAKAGYYVGVVDGTYGAALKSAIEAYEDARHVPALGIASDDVLARLRLDPATAPAR